MQRSSSSCRLIRLAQTSSALAAMPVSAALSSLPAGALVCFTDSAAHPLCITPTDGALRPSRALACTTTSAADGTTTLPPTLHPGCVFTVLRDGAALGFKSVTCGRTLQAVGGKSPHRLANANFGSWEKWVPHATSGLVNQRWGTPLGWGLVVVRPCLASDLKAFATDVHDEVKQLHAALAAAEARNESLTRMAAAAEATARAEAGRGWAALQAQLRTAESARAAAVATMAQQAAALEAAKSDASKAQASASRALASAEAAEQRWKDSERALAHARDRISSLQKQVKDAAQQPQQQQHGGGESDVWSSAGGAGGAHAVSPATQPLVQLANERVGPRAGWGVIPPIPESAGSSQGEGNKDDAAAAPPVQHHAAAGAARKKLDLDKGVVAQPAPPLGRRDGNAMQQPVHAQGGRPAAANELFMGLWEPCAGGVTPSVPRRAATLVEPRLAGWRAPSFK